MNSDEIQNIIFKALDYINDLRETPIIKHSETKLFSESGALDSLDLVNLIVEIENCLREVGFEVVLVNEKAMSLNNSPFKDVKSLAEYIQLTLEEGQ